MRETPGHHDWLERRLSDDDRWADGVGSDGAWTSRAFGDLADTSRGEFVSMVDDDTRGTSATVPDADDPSQLAAVGSRSLGEVLDDGFDALAETGRFTPAPPIDVLDEPDPGDVADPGDVLVGVALGAVDALAPAPPGLADPFDVAPPVGTTESAPIELGDDIVGVSTELATPVTDPLEPSDAMQPVVDVDLPEVRPAAVEFDEIDLTDDTLSETPIDDGAVDDGADLFDEDVGE